MAAALLARHGGPGVTVRSAGSIPASQIHPVVREAMAEIGIDLGSAGPRALSDDDVRASDVVVTMGCGDACPVFPGKRYLDWDLPDPAGKDLSAVRLIRGQIEERVKQLVQELDDRAGGS